MSKIAHTLFNIAIAIIFLPFITPFSRLLIKRLLPDKPDIISQAQSTLIRIVLASPSLALVQATRGAEGRLT